MVERATGSDSLHRRIGGGGGLRRFPSCRSWSRIR